MRETLLTVNEAATRLAIGRTTRCDLIANQQLRSIKIGRARRVPESALEEWIIRQLRDQAHDLEAGGGSSRLP